MRLQGRTALVTGASRNIGRAIAVAMAREGANVVVHSHGYPEGAEETARLVREQGVRVLTVQADVGDPQEVTAMVGHALGEFGVVDILVNNAGYRPGGATLELAPEDWRRVLAVNLDGPFFCAQAILPGMVEQRWGRIINISGISAFLGHLAEPHVSASKAGLLGLTHALATEFAQSNILVNTVVPGLIRIDPSPSIPILTPQYLDEAADRQPLGRVGRPEDIAAMCVHLASEGGDYITGQTLHVNGGRFYT